MNRRGLLLGLGGILASSAAPAIVREVMPLRTRIASAEGGYLLPPELVNGLLDVVVFGPALLRATVLIVDEPAPRPLVDLRTIPRLCSNRVQIDKDQRRRKASAASASSAGGRSN